MEQVRNLPAFRAPSKWNNQDGTLTPEAFKWLQQLWLRTGGNSGDSIYDALDIGQASAASEAQLFATRAELEQLLTGIVLQIIEQVRDNPFDLSGLLGESSFAGLIAQGDNSVLTGDVSIAGIVQQAIDIAAVKSVSGTSNQITAVTSAGAVSLSLPSTLIAPGTFESTGNVTIDTTETFKDQGAAPSFPATTKSLVWSQPQIDTTNISQLWVANNVSSLAIGYETHMVVYNKTGSTIAAGKVVYISGSHAHTPTIALAKSDTLGTLPAVGMTQYAIANNSWGVIHTEGVITNLDTSAYTAGDLLYVSDTTAGNITTTTPTTKSSYMQMVGVVSYANPTQGSIQIFPQTPTRVVHAPDYDRIVATAGQTVFNTTVSTIANTSGKNYVMVTKNGLVLSEGGGNDYTVTGANQITLIVAAALNDVLTFRAWG
jgi:hypothetical protein